MEFQFSRCMPKLKESEVKEDKKPPRKNRWAAVLVSVLMLVAQGRLDRVCLSVDVMPAEAGAQVCLHH